MSRSSHVRRRALPAIAVLSPVVLLAVGYGALQVAGSGAEDTLGSAPLEPVVRTADLEVMDSSPRVILDEVKDARASVAPEKAAAKKRTVPAAPQETGPTDESVCIRFPGLDSLNAAGGTSEAPTWTLVGPGELKLASGSIETGAAHLPRQTIVAAERLVVAFGPEPRETVLVSLDSLDVESDEVESDAFGVEAAETAAIATLRSIAAAQRQLQASAAIDTDHDGGGEYGYFAEMAGATLIRGTDVTLDPTYLPKSFGNVTVGSNGGVKVRNGYVYQITLPADGGGRPFGGLTEAPIGGSGPSMPGASGAEVMWCCYAWPLYETPGEPRRTFFINQDGNVIGTTREANRPYVGRNRGPRFDAAYSAVEDMGSLSGLALASLRANDGNTWVPVAN